MTPKEPRLNFAQRHGFESVPSQLTNDLSKHARAALMAALLRSIESYERFGERRMPDPWYSILARVHVFYEGESPIKYDGDFSFGVTRLDYLLTHKDFWKVLSLIEYILRDRDCPSELAPLVNLAFSETGSAFRVFGGDTIAPVRSEFERDSIESALGQLSTGKLAGARMHLKNGASNLTAGKFADSIRESIHAVESVARVLSPGTKGLGKALQALEKSASIHGSLKKAFEQLYGYTSQEEGMRHPRVSAENGNVDQTDAIFMLGACASFVSYLIAKARAVGIDVE